MTTRDDEIGALVAQHGYLTERLKELYHDPSGPKSLEQAAITFHQAMQAYSQNQQRQFELLEAQADILRRVLELAAEG